MTSTRALALVLTAVLALAIGSTATADTALPLLWVRQHGSSESDRSRGLAADRSGNVYMTGVTYGDLGGAPYDQTARRLVVVAHK